MSKVFILCMIAIMLIAMPVFAESTVRGDYTIPSSPGLEHFLDTNDCFQHSHEYDRADQYDRVFGIGTGLDVIVFECDAPIIGQTAIETQYRADLTNKEQTVMIVGKFNLYRAIKKMWK